MTGWAIFENQLRANTPELMAGSAPNFNHRYIYLDILRFLHKRWAQWPWPFHLMILRFVSLFLDWVKISHRAHRVNDPGLGSIQHSNSPPSTPSLRSEELAKSRKIKKKCEAAPSITQHKKHSAEFAAQIPTSGRWRHPWHAWRNHNPGDSPAKEHVAKGMKSIPVRGQFFSPGCYFTSDVNCVFPE
jgi:hypothetical protein